MRNKGKDTAGRGQSVSKGKQHESSPPVQEEGVDPAKREHRCAVRREEVGRDVSLRLHWDGSGSWNIIVVFYFFVSLSVLSCWTYSGSSMQNARYVN